MLDLSALFFGIFCGIFIFTFAKAVGQTQTVWKNTRNIHNVYLYLIWGEALSNLIFAIFTFLFMSGIIKGALWFYILTVVLWSFQVQLLPQIIANRLALIMTDHRKAVQLRLGLATIITPICITVCYVWTVAHLEGATSAQKRTNIIFEKVEKSFFLVVDLTLNIYFLYLVRYKLIANGLNKYWKLFNFNCCMVAISTTLDALLLGFLSLPDTYVYVQYAPAAYISKLYIELVMASLISKIVKRSVFERNDDSYPSRKEEFSSSADTKHRSIASPGWSKQGNIIMNKLSSNTAVSVREGSNGSEIHLTTYSGAHGITKTIEHTVVVESPEDGESQRTKQDGAGRTFRQSF